MWRWLSLCVCINWTYTVQELLWYILCHGYRVWLREPRPGREDVFCQLCDPDIASLTIVYLKVYSINSNQPISSVIVTVMWRVSSGALRSGAQHSLLWRRNILWRDVCVPLSLRLSVVLLTLKYNSTKTMTVSEPRQVALQTALSALVSVSA